jgi:hypothetical protein
MLDEARVVGLTEDDVRRIVQEELEKAQKRDAAAKKAAIIASKGTLDFAYPPLILATTATRLAVLRWRRCFFVSAVMHGS